MDKKFPFKAWALSKDFKLIELTFVRKSESGLYCGAVDPNTGIYTCCRDIFETKSDALSAGFAALEKERLKNDSIRAELIKAHMALISQDDAPAVKGREFKSGAWHVSPGNYVIPVVILSLAGQWDAGRGFQATTLYSGYSPINDPNGEKIKLFFDKDLFFTEIDALIEAIDRQNKHNGSINIHLLNGQNLMSQLKCRLDLLSSEVIGLAQKDGIQ